MATHRPGRLARTLAKITAANPAFALYSEPTGPIYDADIHGATIHRGKAGRGGGYHPSIMEVDVRGALPASLSGDNCRLFLRDLAAADLAAHTGTTAAAIMYRFQGRAGKLSVTDTGRRFSTTLSATSWLARQGTLGTRVVYPQAGWTLDRLFSESLDLAGTGAPRGVTITFSGDFDPIAAAQDPVLFSEAATRYGSDIGIYFRETREGHTNVYTLPQRKLEADNKAAAQLPLTRSQAISPAAWEQANEYPAFVFEFNVTNPDGNIVTRTIDVPVPGEALRGTVHEDWSYIQSDTSGTSGQLYMEAYGRVLESTARRYSLPSISVDLLHLLGSDKQYHRDQAGQLLTMEAGDPVFLSGDWPAAVQGAHFAEGITEKIGPDEWTLELALVPYAHGVGAGPQPTIRPRVWDSLGTARWDDLTQKWDEL